MPKPARRYLADPAVRLIKRLPKNRNVSSALITYQCMDCLFVTGAATTAWVHSYKHGPWEVIDSGVFAPLPTPKKVLYNSEKRIFAVYSEPHIWRLR